MLDKITKGTIDGTKSAKDFTVNKIVITKKNFANSLNKFFILNNLTC